MDIDRAIEFYNTIKTTYYEEQFSEFFDYFETTWLNPNKDIKTKFEFDIWSYYGKFDFKNQRKKYLISEEALDEYIFLSNNACESCNNLINNYIEINSKVGLSKFETILKSLFIRMESNRVNKNQLSERIITKRLVSDNLLSLINFGVGLKKKLISEKDLKKIKNVNKEEDFLKLNIVCSDDEEEEKADIESNSDKDENSYSINNSD